MFDNWDDIVQDLWDITTSNKPILVRNRQQKVDLGEVYTQKCSKSSKKSL